MVDCNYNNYSFLNNCNDTNIYLEYEKIVKCLISLSLSLTLSYAMYLCFLY